VIAEWSGVKSGWLKGRKGSVEGWFPEDFVMPVLSESNELRPTVDVCQSAADYSNVDNSYYSNLPPQ